jgi:transcriptional antiterminator NusG
MTTDNVLPEQPESGHPPVSLPHVPEAADAPDDLEAEEPAEVDGEEAPPDQPPAIATEEQPAPAPSNLSWYVVKVQSGREESIKDAIERRVKIDNLQDCFGQIVIPTEKVSEMRKNKRYIRERKLLPGYLMAHVEFNDRMLYLFRETSGVGDFVGGGFGKKPLPMSDREIQKWVGKPTDGSAPVEPDKGKSPFNEGDRVRVKDGMFAGMEGSVKQILEAKGAVVVELTIFGRPVPVELEYWQVDFE